MVSWRGPVDSDIKWETTAQYNLGVDFGLFNNRLTFTADYYYKKTRDLLQEVKIPSSTGFSNKLTNSGNVTNKGLELTLGITPVDSHGWHWNINANLAFNKNEIGGLNGDQYANTLWDGADNVFIQRNGCPIGAIYGYVEDGFYNNEAAVRADPQYTFASAATVKSKIGEIRYLDLNHDGKITEADRTIIGDTNPDYTWGLTNNLTWKWPKASSGYERNFLVSNRYVEDGSYIKLKNISLTYNWNHPFKSVGLERLQFSFTATNVFTITDYSWYDPDVNAFGSDSSRRGVDIYSYPSARTFTFGINATF